MSQTIDRILDPSEYPTAVKLWVEVFNVPAPFFETLLAAGENVSVGTFVDGELVSSVHVFMRWVRDRKGEWQKVGGIGSVSTHENHRRQGHSGRLLTLAIEEMGRAGCAWSYLGTGVNDHYARYGWWTYSTRSWRLEGDLASGSAAEVRELTTSEADLAAMAKVYEAHSEAPMKHLRSEGGWRTAIAYRLKPPILGFPADGPLEGYLVGNAGEDAWAVTELVGSSSVKKVLAGEFLRRANEAGIRKLVFNTGRDLAEEAIPGAAFIPSEGRYMMARPIGGRISDSDLAAVLADPRGRHCDLDNF